MKLEIVEMISTLRGNMIYTVIDNNGHSYPEYGRFKTKKEAQELINKLNEND